MLLTLVGRLVSVKIDICIKKIGGGGEGRGWREKKEEKGRMLGEENGRGNGEGREDKKERGDKKERKGRGREVEDGEEEERERGRKV